MVRVDLDFSRDVGPGEVVIATSTASLPRAISIRPTRGVARLPLAGGGELRSMPADQAWLAPITGGEAVTATKFAGDPLKAAKIFACVRRIEPGPDCLLRLQSIPAFRTSAAMPHGHGCHQAIGRPVLGCLTRSRVSIGAPRTGNSVWGCGYAFMPPARSWIPGSRGSLTTPRTGTPSGRASPLSGSQPGGSQTIRPARAGTTTRNASYLGQFSNHRLAAAILARENAPFGAPEILAGVPESVFRARKCLN